MRNDNPIHAFISKETKQWKANVLESLYNLRDRLLEIKNSKFIMGAAKTLFEGLNFQAYIEFILFGPGNQPPQNTPIDTGEPTFDERLAAAADNLSARRRSHFGVLIK